VRMGRSMTVRAPVLPIGKPAASAPPPLFFAASSIKHVQQLYAQGLPCALHGMLPMSFSGSVEPPSAADQLASLYVEAILAKQPRGPYRLGGYCVSGLLAMEVAQQLIAAGRRVELLLLVNTIDPELLPNRVAPISGIIGWERPSPLDHPAVQDALAATTQLRHAGVIGVPEVVDRTMTAIRMGLQERLSSYELEMVAELYEAVLWTSLLAATYQRRSYPGRITYVYNTEGIGGDGLAASELQASESNWRNVATEGLHCLRVNQVSVNGAELALTLAPEFVTYVRERLMSIVDGQGGGA
jgi:thioesterase domain-containing protein